MKYLLTLYRDESSMADRTPDQQAEAMQAWDEYTQNTSDAGVFVGGEGLQTSSTATTVRIDPTGDPIVSDGPFAETKEQLGGFFLIEAKDLDEACALAARFPPARIGTIEVRPVQELRHS